MKDFKLTINGQSAVMDLEAADSLPNNIWLSLHIARGVFFIKPDFGSRLHTLKKITDNNLRLAEAYCTEALQWLVTTGRIAGTDVIAARDSDVPGRIIINVGITQIDGDVDEFEVYYSVI